MLNYDYKQKNIQELDVPEAKKSKKQEALQELLEIQPDLKGKSVYFFSKMINIKKVH